jgi:hypothetical protein
MTGWLNDMIELLNAAGEVFWRFSSAMFVQTTILVGILAVLDVLLLRRLRASVRYAVWTLVLAKLVLPVSLSSPVSIARLMPTFGSRPVEETEWSIASVSASFADYAVSGREERPIARAQPDTSNSLHWNAWVLASWLGVESLLFAILIRRARHVRRIVARSEPPPETLQVVLNECLDTARMRRSNVRLRVTRDLRHVPGHRPDPPRARRQPRTAAIVPGLCPRADALEAVRSSGQYGANGAASPLLLSPARVGGECGAAPPEGTGGR